MRERERIEESRAERGACPEPQPLRRPDAAGVLALQQTVGNHAVSQLLQRKLDLSLAHGDANLRVQQVLNKPPKGKFGASAKPDTTRYDAIVSSSKVYTWEDIEAEFGPFEQNLNGYAQAGTRQIRLYRADGRSPAKLKGSNPPGFGVRSNVPFSLLKAALLKDPAGFVEDQVRQNRQDLKSYATNQNAGGYASNDRPLYEVDLGVWHEFRRPQRSGAIPSAIILADANDLGSATRIVIDTLKPTGELFLLFELGLTDITSARLPGSNAFTPIAWDTITAEKPNR